MISETKNNIGTIVEALEGASLAARMPSLEAYVAASGRAPLSYPPFVASGMGTGRWE